ITAAVHGYRTTMRAAAKSTVLGAWYDRLDAERVRRWIRKEQRELRAGDAEVQRLEAAIEEAQKRDHQKAFAKLVRVVDGRLRIIADPPLITPVEDLIIEADDTSDEVSVMRRVLESYR